jgi:hypothetical protein
MKKKILIGSSVLVVLLVAGMAFASGIDQDSQSTGPRVAPEIHEQIVEALETGDYALWLQVHEDNDLPVRPEIAEVINEENFDSFAELHEAMRSGDRETAKAIADELGLEKPLRKGLRRGMREGPRDGSRTGPKDGSGREFKGMRNCSCPNTE